MSAPLPHPFAVPQNMYGPTEASIIVTLHAVGAGPGAAPAPSPDNLAVLPIGTPLPGSGARLLVLDGAQQPVPVGGVGELYIAGPVLACGYWGRCALTVWRGPALLPAMVQLCCCLPAARWSERCSPSPPHWPQGAH